tara:strand:- start:354 stop:638 length:285 start_codon:yes stop_codon:yes gene_type:complete
MIKEQKIPSPSQITKAVAPKDIEEIKTLQLSLNNLNSKFGQLYITKMKLEKEETILKNELSSLEEKETIIAKTFTDKYGKGSLDIETGEFTPVE